MVPFGLCRAIMLYLAVLAAEQTPPPGPVPQEPPLRDAVAAEGNGRDTRGGTDVRGAAERLRELQRELDELANKAKAIPREERTRWELDRSLELAQKAQHAGCQREFLEILLRLALARSRDMTGPLSGFDLTCNTIVALAWLVLEKNLVAHEKERFVPGPTGSPGVYGARPGGVRGVLSSWYYTPGDFFGTAFAAIDSYEDERAREFLLDVALKTSRAGKFLPRIERALRFLTCYAPQDVEPKLKAAYEAPRGLKGDYLGNLRVVLDELTYVKSLDPAAQKRYQRILRIVLRASVIAPQGTASDEPGRYTTQSFLLDWQEGDERFLPHMIEMRFERMGLPQTTRAIDTVGARMVVRGPVSAKGLAWLKEQAESGDWPAMVKKELGSLLRERENLQEKMREKKRSQAPLPAKDTKSK